MEAVARLRLMAEQMDLEPAEETALSPVAPVATGTGTAVAPCGASLSPDRPKANRQAELGITHAVLPNGGTIPLLKTMLTTACERNCYYCPFRAGRSYRRATFKPAEMAQVTHDMYRAGLIQGLFLSSGIIGGGVKTQDKLLETIDILRRRHQFRGYVHLKIMPGAEQAQVRRAMELADRLSVNLEAPTTARLQQLAPMKQFVDELVRPLQWIEQIRRTEPAREGWNGRWPSTATQFVVGAVGDSDLELLSTTDYLLRQTGLRRAYFSAFRPIADTPLADRPPTPPLRQHRLYQASFLLRDYKLEMEEMPFDRDGNLPLDQDPKLALAWSTLAEQPVELNRADREQLLRVPGIGPKGATAIVRARRQATLRELADLQKIGVVTTRLAPFVLLDGRRPTYQLPLL